MTTEKDQFKPESKSEPIPKKTQEEELRSTWKTKPKISSLLPLPFTTYIPDKSVDGKKPSKLLLTAQLENAVSAEEYRKTEQQLSPIKMVF